MPCSYSIHGKIIMYTLDHPRLRKIIFQRNISSKKERKRESKKQILEYIKVHPCVGFRLGPIDENQYVKVKHQKLFFLTICLKLLLHGIEEPRINFRCWGMWEMGLLVHLKETLWTSVNFRPITGFSRNFIILVT